MNVEPERVVLLVILTVCAILMTVAGNYLMDFHQPVRQESQLLENFLIMQSMAGKNTTPSNLTYVIESTGLVVSFNDILTDSGIQVHRSPKGTNTSTR
jgi:DMSO reductase anchor subunit